MKEQSLTHIATTAITMAFGDDTVSFRGPPRPGPGQLRAKARLKAKAEANAAFYANARGTPDSRQVLRRRARKA